MLVFGKPLQRQAKALYLILFSPVNLREIRKDEELPESKSSGRAFRPCVQSGDTYMLVPWSRSLTKLC
jgi:hypothetical protein